MYVFVTRDIYVYVHVYFVYICIVIYIFQAYNTPGTFMSSFASSLENQWNLWSHDGHMNSWFGGMIWREESLKAKL